MYFPRIQRANTKFSKMHGKLNILKKIFIVHSLLLEMIWGHIANTKAFQVDLELSGALYDAGSLGKFKSETLSICSVYCIQYQCKAFSFSPWKKVCLLYDQVFCNVSQGGASPGANFYIAKYMTDPNSRLPKDCRGVPGKGMFLIQPKPGKTMRVWCEDKGWTVFQQRFDGGVDFYRSWDSYMQGFGYPGQEHWLGNEHLHTLTSTGQTELRVELESFEGTFKFAQYSHFYIAGSDDNFRLRIHGLSNCSTAGHAMLRSNGHEFFTHDRDSRNLCAEQALGAWWMNDCCTCNSNLNGRYTRDRNKRAHTNVFWVTFGERFLPLKSTKMMLRLLN